MCRQVQIAPNVVGHAKEKHRLVLSKVEAAALKKRLVELDAVNSSLMLPRPVAYQDPVELLQVHDRAIYCNACPRSYMSSGSAANHWSECHGADLRERLERFSVGPVQSFSSSIGKT